jgi:hypothetical protein
MEYNNESVVITTADAIRQCEDALPRPRAGHPRRRPDRDLKGDLQGGGREPDFQLAGMLFDCFSVVDHIKFISNISNPLITGGFRSGAIPEHTQ